MERVNGQCVSSPIASWLRGGGSLTDNDWLEVTLYWLVFKILSQNGSLPTIFYSTLKFKLGMHFE